MPNYTLDKGLEDLATDLINRYKPGLKEVKIAYVFRPEAVVSNGRAVAGMCIRTDDRNRTIHEHDFIIEIAKDIWTDATDQFREAIMYHELCHCGIRTDEQGIPLRDEHSGRLKTYCKPHSIEEFEEVLEKYGPYHKNLRSFLDAFAAHKAKQKKKADSEKLADAAE